MIQVQWLNQTFMHLVRHMGSSDIWNEVPHSWNSHVVDLILIHESTKIHVRLDQFKLRSLHYVNTKMLFCSLNWLHLDIYLLFMSLTLLLKVPCDMVYKEVTYSLFCLASVWHFFSPFQIYLDSLFEILLKHLTLPSS